MNWNDIPARRVAWLASGAPSRNPASGYVSTQDAMRWADQAAARATRAANAKFAKRKRVAAEVTRRLDSIERSRRRGKRVAQLSSEPGVGQETATFRDARQRIAVDVASILGLVLSQVEERYSSELDKAAKRLASSKGTAELSAYMASLPHQGIVELAIRDATRVAQFSNPSAINRARGMEDRRTSMIDRLTKLLAASEADVRRIFGKRIDEVIAQEWGTADPGSEGDAPLTVGNRYR